MLEQTLFFAMLMIFRICCRAKLASMQMILWCTKLLTPLKRRKCSNMTATLSINGIKIENALH